MARFDTLTGLPNRLLINETLARAMAEAEKWGSRCAFMMIDLDRFKAVNDTLGHPIGDRLLGRVSERLGAADDRQRDDRPAGRRRVRGRRPRRDRHRRGRAAGAARSSTTLSRPYEVDQHTLYIGASVGLAIGPRDGRTAEMLIRSADLALYRVEGCRRRRRSTPTSRSSTSQAEERRVLEMALRSALEKGEMHLDYQPVVDAGTGQLTGFEALLRWTHPEFGNVSPGQVHPAGRGSAADRPDRRMGAAHRLRRGGALARRTSASRSTSRPSSSTTRNFVADRRLARSPTAACPPNGSSWK